MKKIKNIFLLMITISALAACKKDLDQQPKDTFSDVNAFITLEDVQKGVNAAYSRYGYYQNPVDLNIYKSYASNMYVSALLSDEAKIGADNTGFGGLTYRYQFSSDPTTGADVTEAWGGYYAMIDQINRVLPHVSTVTATAAEEPRRNILKAQLLALRGIAHFELLQAYCKNYDPADNRGIPVMLVSDALGKPSRNTMANVMARIETDLTDAKAGLPATTASDFTDTVMNQVNIAAYQARIALYRKDYDAAITFATEVINSGVKPLASGAGFADIWTDASDSETLFRIRFATDDLIGTLWTTTGGQVSIAPSDKLVSSYDANDIRATAYIGTNGAGNNFVNKFFISSRGGRVVDLKACRIAEMYLIRAEAYAKRSAPDLVAGAQDLNLLRSNRIAGYVDETFGSTAELNSAVLNERFKELAFEGFRFFDLKRNNLPVERLASDANPAWQTLPASSNLFVLPIPRYEMDANPNMIQNDGY